MGNRKRIATMILLYLGLSLLSLPLCSASECSEAVEEVCQEVITENNDQLLETVAEMVADRPCDTSNMIQKEHLDQLYEKNGQFDICGQSFTLYKYDGKSRH